MYHRSECKRSYECSQIRMKEHTNLETQKYCPSRRTVIVLDGALVVAYNTDKPYPKQLLSDPQRTSVVRYHIPHYESNNVPYLCAAPALPYYAGALFDRLKQTETQFPIVKGKEGYKLEPSLAISWLKLQNLLEDIAYILLSSSRPYVAMDYRSPPSPSSYGYLSMHSTRKTALIAIQKSRDAFRGLIAHASWGAILHRHRDILRKASEVKKLRELNETPSDFDVSSLDPSVYDEGWKAVLSDPEIEMHPAWFHALTQSAVGDFSIRRAGLVIRKPIDWTYSDLIPTLILSNIPVWMIWGTTDASLPEIPWPDWAKETFGPNAYEKSHATMWTDKLNIGLVHLHPHLRNINKEIQQRVDAQLSKKNDFPVGSTNKGMDIHEWIRMTKEQIDVARARASDEQRHRYDQRQADAELFKCPGKRGPVVFEWERDELNRPIRSTVTRANVEQTWCLFGDKQRWYNCVRNEWELCRELDPSDDPYDESDDVSFYGDLEIEDQDAEPQLASEHPGEIVHFQNSKSFTNSDHVNRDTDWPGNRKIIRTFNLREHLLGLLHSDAPSHSASETSSKGAFGELGWEIGLDAMQFLCKRLGFSYRRGSNFESVRRCQWSLVKAMRVIGDSKDKKSFIVEDGLEAAAIQFIMHLNSVGHSDSPTSQIPSSLCDLYESNACALKHVKSAVSIQTACSPDGPLYVVHHDQDKDRQWLLAVSDPCTALQAIRSDPPTLNEFVLGLIYSRTPFRTLRRVGAPDSLVKPDVTNTRRRRRIGLGKRPTGHKLDKADFVVYELERNRLLENQRIARAAIKRGGILSRLVHDLVDDSHILSGPSSEALEHPFKTSLIISGKSVTYYDDDISEEESSVLVGLYSIKAGKSRTSLLLMSTDFKVVEDSAPSEQSWWPTAAKFEASGLNVFAWTPRCEEWFLRRRKGIVEEGYSTCSASDWRTYLKCEGETKRVYKGARILSSKYITGSP